MSLFRGDDKLPRNQAVDTIGYFMQNHQYGMALAKLAYNTGRVGAFLWGVEKFIEILCKWAPTVAGGVHYID